MGHVGRLRRALGLMDHSIAAVVFTVPEKRLREMDIATGPCLPIPTRKKPLVGVSRQDGGEEPHHTAALYTALTGEPAEGVLTVQETCGRGALHRFERPFVDAMAAAKERLVALGVQDDADGDHEMTRFTQQLNAFDKAWLAAARWPRGVTGTNHRLDRLHWAKAARDREQPLYCWFGPAVPMYYTVGSHGD